MSYNNFNDINPLVAVYKNSSRTTSGTVVSFQFDTSLYSGTISSNILTVDYPCTLRGDFYGNTTENIIVNSQFNIDGVDQYQCRDHFSGFGGGNIGGSEVFFADASANIDIKAKYRTNGNLSLTTFAKFPRITGVLIK